MELIHVLGYSKYMRLENALVIINQLVKIGGHQCPEQILVNTEGSPMLHRTPYRLSRLKSGGWKLRFEV